MGLFDGYGCAIETIVDPTPGEWYDEDDDEDDD